MARAGFSEYENCMWCNVETNRHLFVDCLVVTGFLINWGIGKLGGSKDEWIQDHVNRKSKDWKAVKSLISIIKFAIWKAYAEERYGR